MMIPVLGLGLSAQMGKSSACESLFPYMCFYFCILFFYD